MTESGVLGWGSEEIRSRKRKEWPCPNTIIDNTRLEAPWEYQKLAETDDHI